MVLLNLTLLLIALFFSVLAGILAAKKSAGKKVGNFFILFISFFVSVGIVASGVFDFLGALVLKLIPPAAEIFEKTATENSFFSAVSGFLARILVFDIVFWLVYGMIKLIYGLILKIVKAKRCKFYAPASSRGLAITAGVMGGVTRWFFYMLSILPLFAVATTITPALKAVSKEDYSDTYVYELTTALNDKYFVLTEDSYLVHAARYTGAGLCLDPAMDSLGAAQMGKGDSAVSYNVRDVLSGAATLAAKGMVVYERQLKNDKTYSDFVILLEVVEEGSASPVIVGAASELLGAGEVEIPEGGSLMKGIVDNILAHYNGEGGADNLQNDMLVINDVLTQFIEYNKDKAFDTEALGDDFLDYLVKGDTDDLIETISKLSSFNDVMVLSSNYGVQMLCEAMGIPMNKTEAYDNLTADILKALNDKTQGEIDFNVLDGFIKYLSESAVTVEEYRQNSYDEQNGDDPACINYDRYMSVAGQLNEVFDKYGLTQEGPLVFSVSGKLYQYNEETDIWSEINVGNEDKLNIFTQYLIASSDGFSDGEDSQFTQDELTERANEFIESAQSSSELDSATKEYNVKIAKATISPDELDVGFTYGEEILAAIGAEESREGDSEALKGIFTGVLELMEISEKEDVTDAMLSNFGEIGKMVDSLNKYSVTEDVPELLLKALSQSENFSKYLYSDSIQKITENVKAEKSTYEELFSSIQALYNIASEIL